jgi:hypothetical protein
VQVAAAAACDQDRASTGDYQGTTHSQHSDFRVGTCARQLVSIFCTITEAAIRIGSLAVGQDRRVRAISRRGTCRQGHCARARSSKDREP